MSTHPDKMTEKPPQSAGAAPKAVEVDSPADASLEKLFGKEAIPKSPYTFNRQVQGALPDEYVRSQYPQNTIAWEKYSLFKPDEEDSQYLTFKSRSGEGEANYLRTRAGEDGGNGKLAGPGELHSRTSGDGSPPQGQAPKKKKMTLAEYTNKDRNKVTTPALKSTAPESKNNAKSADKETNPTTKNSDVTKPQQTVNLGQKRTAEAMTETKQTPSSARRSPSPPAKKTRVDDEPNKKVLEQPQSKTPSQDLQTALALNKSETRIGEQLPVETNPAESNTSDTVEATSQSTQPGRPTMPILPPMLSPLSSVVEAEICKLTAAARDNEIGSEKSQSSVNSPSVTPTKSSNNDPKTVSKTGKTSNVEKVVTVAKLSKSTVPTKGPQEQRQTPSAISKGTKDIQSKAVHTPKAAPNEQFNNGKLVPTSTPKTTPPDVQKKIRLRVGLKIKKKANRKNLGNYLSLKPTPGRNSLFPNRQAEQVHRPTSSQTSAKHDSNERDARTAKKVDPKPSQSKDPKTGEKRGRPQIEESDIEPPSKRKLAGRLPQMQKPSTPTSVGTSSPVISHLGSAHKPTSTPSTQAHGAAMLRGASGQGSVDTPQQSVATGTPAAPTTGRRRRSYTSPNKPKSPNLRHESQPYQEMARVLKHAADVYLKNWDQVNETERKRGVVLGTESVLSFMLAFVLLDTGLSYSDRNSWNSIIPFLSSLQNFSQQLADPTHMSGLLYQIEALIRDQISYADLQKLDRNPLQPEHGDVDVNVDKVQGQHNAAEYHKQFQAFHTHVMRAQSAWRSGWMKLDNDALSSQYPGTWGRRAEHRYAYGKGRDAVKKGEYSRNYNLPLNNMTSGLEGVNFGMNFLAEWSKANGVEWEPKLVL